MDYIRQKGLSYYGNIYISHIWRIIPFIPRSRYNDWKVYTKSSSKSYTIPMIHLSKKSWFLMEGIMSYNDYIIFIIIISWFMNGGLYFHIIPIELRYDINLSKKSIKEVINKRMNSSNLFWMNRLYFQYFRIWFIISI